MIYHDPIEEAIKAKNVGRVGKQHEINRSDQVKESAITRHVNSVNAVHATETRTPKHRDLSDRRLYDHSRLYMLSGPARAWLEYGEDSTDEDRAVGIAGMFLLRYLRSVIMWIHPELDIRKLTIVVLQIMLSERTNKPRVKRCHIAKMINVDKSQFSKNRSWARVCLDIESVILSLKDEIYRIF